MSQPADPEKVAQAARRGLSWNLISAVIMNGTRLGIVAVLGRTLDSHDFGVVAAALSVTVFFYSIRDVGVGRAIIQRKDLDPAHLSTAFAVSTYLGFALTGLLVAAAPL